MARLGYDEVIAKINAVILLSPDIEVDVFREQARPVLERGVPIFVFVSTARPGAAALGADPRRAATGSARSNAARPRRPAGHGLRRLRGPRRRSAGPFRGRRLRRRCSRCLRNLRDTAADFFE